jgi:hypothetical protein
VIADRKNIFRRQPARQHYCVQSKIMDAFERVRTVRLSKDLVGSSAFNWCLQKMTGSRAAVSVEGAEHQPQARTAPWSTIEDARRSMSTFQLYSRCGIWLQRHPATRGKSHDLRERLFMDDNLNPDTSSPGLFHVASALIFTQIDPQTKQFDTGQTCSRGDFVRAECRTKCGFGHHS